MMLAGVSNSERSAGGRATAWLGAAVLMRGAGSRLGLSIELLP